MEHLKKSIETTVAPDGIITIEGFGPIQVSGLSVEQANKRVKAKLGKRYSSSSIRLSVGQTHTIMVNVLGEVKTPGTYTLSAFSTVFNALYMAGGIGKLGTLRNIKVYRRGKLISTVDVYDFLRKGKISGNVRLSDNDVIVVGAYDLLVNITGKVKRPMFYEMKRNESLASLIRYAGGFTGDAYRKNVRVNRKTGRKYSIYNVNEFDMNKFSLFDEDSVSVDSVIPRYENMVEIRGAVFRPGKYELGGHINTVRNLIDAAEGLTEVAFAPHAVMHRMKSDRTLEAIAIDVEGILLGKKADVPLQNEDILFIPTRSDVKEERTISILGEVIYPGKYKYADNETLEDLILQAGGLTDKASTVRVDVSRRNINPEALETDSIISQSFTFKLKDGFVIDGQPGFILAPYDQVYVRKSPGTTYQQNVTISILGEVIYPGKYKYADNETLEDLILQAGGLTDKASTVRVDVSRRNINPEALETDSIISQSFTFKLKDGFVIDGQPGFILAPYDQVYVRKSPGTTYQQNVTIEGEVLFAGTYPLTGSKTRLSDIFKAAGGATDLAYLDGAKLERIPNKVERMRMESILKMQKEKEDKKLLELAAHSNNASSVIASAKQMQNTFMEKFEVPATYPVGINLTKALANPGSDADLILREGDRILIPKYNGTVRINGAVMYPNAVSYVEGRDVAYYINQAGGFSSDAKKSRTYILYMNGTSAKVGYKTKVKPGCEIIVPTKNQVRMSLPEILSIGSSASSMAAILVTLINLFK